MKKTANILLAALILITITAGAQQKIIGDKTIEKIIAERQKALEKLDENQNVFSISPNVFSTNNPQPYAFPESVEVLSWDNGEIYSAIGTGAAINIDVAIRFEPSDLQNFGDYFLTSIEFFPWEEMEVILKVWQGSIGSTTEIFSQSVNSINVGELNTIQLSEPVVIDNSQDFWIGYTASIDDYRYPIGVDAGPAVQFKGDLYRIEGSQWGAISELGIDFNWIIRGYAEILADPQAPAAPGDLNVVAAAQGELNASLNWTNPSLTFGGEPLTELDEITVERNNEVIVTFADPVVGSELSFEDDQLTAPGLYTYKVYGVNSFGNGFFASVAVYLGEDIPAAPENAQLEAIGNDGLISWDAPSEGINGGYLNEDELTYSVKRLPDNILVAQDLTTTEFFDNQIPGAGNYFYKITAANDQGIGQASATNNALLGAEGLLMYESFDYPVGQIPPGWTKTGVPVNWSIYAVNFAGGEPNELNLNWAPQSNGSSRLVTYPISTGDMDLYRFRFKQMFESFVGSGIDDKIAIDISFDGGESWENLWEHDASQNIPAAEFQLPIFIPEQATTMHLGFRFEGNTFNIENWFLDDMIIEPVLDNDLAGITITGPKTLAEGIASNYNVKIRNNGSVTQQDYTVKLMKNGTEEIGSVSGTSIDPAEIQSYELNWIPSAEDVGIVALSGYVDFAGDELTGNNATNTLTAQVFPEGIIPVQIGEGNNVLTALPYDFAWDHSLSQTLYYPDEIGFAGGTIFALGYQADFSDSKLDKSIRIWMGETDREDLTDGWVDPSTLQLVFDGSVDFPSGVNDVVITLDQAFVYTGSNLVIYSNKSDDSWSFGNHFASSFDESRQRTLKTVQDFTPFDPNNPPAPHEAWFYYPNTTLFMNLSGLGSLAGNVTDGTNALEGVKVTLSGVSQPAFTEAEGNYEFPAVIAGTYSAQFELFGFETLVIEDIIVDEDTLTVQDAVLTPIPQYTVTGTIQGNDGNLIGDAQIALEGYAGYEVLSESDGTFAIEGVYEGEYLLSVSAFGYVPAEAENILVDGDIDLGVILLEEQIEAPFNLMVMNEGLEPGQALFSWNNPLTGWEESFEEGELPAEWSQIVSNTGSNANLPATWTISGPVNIYNTTISPQQGDYQVFMMWDFQEQNEWLITKEFTVPAGDLKFWYYGVNGSSFGDNYYVKISTDDGQSWDVLWNASNLPFGQNYYQEPVSINLDMFAGQKARIAWQNEDGPGDFGMWYYWAIDNISIGDAALNLTELMTVTDPRNGIIADARPLSYGSDLKSGFGPDDLNGFNIFLDDELLAEGLTSTQYLFEGLADGTYTAGVQAVFTTGVSDVAQIDFVVDDTKLLILVANPAGSGTLLGSSWYPPGEQVLVNATAEDDYEFVNWTYDNGEVVSEEAAFFFTMPDEDVILIANFAETESLNLTFVIDMTGAGNFEPEDAIVNITGSMHGWNVLGNMARDQALMQIDNSMEYTITLELAPGTYEYAYFMNEGELDEEWENIPNRQVELNQDITVYDVWGIISGIDSRETAGDISVYPNPFDHFIKIDGAAWATRAEISNVFGHKMMDISLAGNRIDTGNLSPGVYLVYLYGENGKQAVRKVIKK